MNLQRSSIWLWECHTTSTSSCYGLHSSELLLPPSPAGMISYRRTGLFVFQFFMAGFNHLIQVFSYLLPCFVSFSATFSLCRNYSIFHLQNEQNAVGSHFLKHHFPPWDYLDWGKMVFCIQEGSSQPEHCLFSFLFSKSNSDMYLWLGLKPSGQSVFALWGELLWEELALWLNSSLLATSCWKCIWWSSGFICEECWKGT